MSGGLGLGHNGCNAFGLTEGWEIMAVMPF